MIRIFIFIFVFLNLNSCAYLKTFFYSTWQEDSNKLSLKFTEELSTLYPELGSSFGLVEFDNKGTVYTTELEQKEQILLKKWHKKITEELVVVENKNLRVDYLILKDVLERIILKYNLDKKYCLLPFSNGTKSVFNNLQNVLGPNVEKSRKASGIKRFISYVNGSVPILEGYKTIFLQKLNELDCAEKIYPFIGEIQKYLQDSESFLKGIEGLLKNSGQSGWQNTFNLFVKQAKAYDSFVKNTILTNARKYSRYPTEVYELFLNEKGIEASANEMIETGKNDFDILYAEFVRLSREIDPKVKTPSILIKKLKDKQITDVESLQVIYEQVANKIDNLLLDKDIITLPNRKLKIRFAGDAESRAIPVPHLSDVPLINNNDIWPEVVIPTSSTGILPFDDFSYEPAIISLFAHEGRPGHDLQFSKMIENKTTLIRAKYAMNSVNAEGWGLYAEDLIYPYITKKEQLIAIQFRLWRIARYFLDPMIQLQVADKAKVLHIFHNVLGVSKLMSLLEYQRYAFRDPAQAPSYYQGLLNLRKFKSTLEKKYGNLKLKCFNDTLVGLGLIPHKYLNIFQDDFKKCKLN